MSYETERKMIEGRFRDAMPPGSAIQYGNNPFLPPKEGYMRISILGGGSGLMGIGSLSQRRHAGVIDVAIFVPNDSGEKMARDLADKIEAALAQLDLRVGSTRICTQGTNYQRLGKVGDWFQANVTVPYQREEY
jgi:hypothetical protein